MSRFPPGTLARVRPGSLPPTLDDENSTDDDELDLPLLQQNPLTYFLTPPTPQEEELEFDFDFDAGIEDANKPQEIVRSVSPSTLDGLKGYKSRSKKNNSRNNDCAILDDDSDSDDDEDYIRFTPGKSFPRGLSGFGYDWTRPSASTTQTDATAADAMLSPSSFHVGSPRGRPVKRFSTPQQRRPYQQGGRPRSLPPAMPRRHSWREPSPEVWSIDEEPEKETLSERGLSTEDLEAYFAGDDHRSRSKPIDIPAAKPKKRVRFVLPGEE
jgi:hypothetical protein